MRYAGYSSLRSKTPFLAAICNRIEITINELTIKASKNSLLCAMFLG